MLANAFRNKTNKQKAAEGKMWEEIFERRGKETQDAQGTKGAKGGGRSKFPQNQNNNTRHYQSGMTLEGNFPQGSSLNTNTNTANNSNTGNAAKPVHTKKLRAPQTRDIAVQDETMVGFQSSVPSLEQTAIFELQCRMRPW